MGRGTITWCRIPAAFLFAFALGQAQTLIIPQVVDGGAWQTTIGLTNEGSSAASASLSFFQEVGGGATQNWNLAFLEANSTQNLNLPGGSTLFLHTPGTAGTTTQGWAQLQASASVVAYAIFTQRVPGRQDQDGTAPAAAGGSRILVPFDNTGGLVTSMAIANPTSSSESISVGIRTASGSASQPSPVIVPAQGHMAFAFPQQFAATTGQSGLAEFYSASGSLSILALRFNPTGAFTTAPVYVVAGPPIIVAGGAAGNTVFAGFSVGKVTSGSGFPTTSMVNEFIGGQFASYTATEWAVPFSGPTFGPCSVFDVTYPASGKDPSSPDTFLDAGATIPVSGPGLPMGAALGKINLPAGPFYGLAPAAGTLAYGGTYTITGNGGTQVGPFSVSATLPSSFSVTNWDSVSMIDRTQPLTVNWTGTGFDQVIIHVQSAILTSTTTHNTVVSCAVPASAGTFSVPVGALAYLQPTVGSISNVGQLSVTVGTATSGTVTAVSTTAQTLTPSLVGGGQVNFGSFAPFLSVAKNVPIQ